MCEFKYSSYPSNLHRNFLTHPQMNAIILLEEDLHRKPILQMKPARLLIALNKLVVDMR